MSRRAQSTPLFWFRMQKSPHLYGAILISAILLGETCSFQLSPPLGGLFQLCLAQSVCCGGLPYPLFTLFNFEDSRLQREGAQVSQTSPLCSPPQTSVGQQHLSHPGACLECRIAGLTSARFLRCPSKSERHWVSPLIVLISQLVVGIRGGGWCGMWR